MMIMKVTSMRNSRKRDAIKNTEELFPNVVTKASNITQMVCVRIATTPKAGPRKHPPASIKIELCMLKAYVKIATCQFTTKPKDLLKRSQVKSTLKQ